MHTIGGSGGVLPQNYFFKIRCSEIASESYLYPNATSPTRVDGRSRPNTAVRHDTRQSSQGVSVTIVIDI